MCWSNTQRTSSSFHWKLTCSHHKIAEKIAELALNNNHSLTHFYLLPQNPSSNWYHFFSLQSLWDVLQHLNDIWSLDMYAISLKYSCQRYWKRFVVAFSHSNTWRINPWNLFLNSEFILFSKNSFRFYIVYAIICQPIKMIIRWVIQVLASLWFVFQFTAPIVS